MQNNQQNGFSAFLNGTAEKPDAKKIMQSLDAEEQRKVFEILGDREKLSALLDSPAAQAIMKKLNGQHQ